jgi:RNAse (barnase) inhibitor barstar
MFDISALKNTNGPWVFQTEDREEKFKFTDPIILSGDAMQTTDDAYNEIYKKLRAPDYAGKNYNALLEILTDLEWIDQKEYVLFFQNSENILIKEKRTVLEGLIETLSSAGEEWSKPINLGVAWDRPAIPFHVIFQLKEITIKSKFDHLPFIISK